MLEGSGTTPFDITIRSAPAAAVDMRTLHKTAGELVALANDDRRARLSKLRHHQSPERAMWTMIPLVWPPITRSWSVRSWRGWPGMNRRVMGSGSDEPLSHTRQATV